MDKQAVFDKVVTHLLTQNAPSTGVVGCMYRGDDGRMCAVGCLIADEHYSEQLECKTVKSLRVQEALRKSGVNVTDNFDDSGVAFLSELQRLHDGRPSYRWRELLESFARDSGLSFNPPKEATNG